MRNTPPNSTGKQRMGEPVFSFGLCDPRAPKVEQQRQLAEAVAYADAVRARFELKNPQSKTSPREFPPPKDETARQLERIAYIFQWALVDTLTKGAWLGMGWTGSYNKYDDEANGVDLLLTRTQPDGTTLRLAVDVKLAAKSIGDQWDLVSKRVNQKSRMCTVAFAAEDGTQAPDTPQIIVGGGEFVARDFLERWLKYRAALAGDPKRPLPAEINEHPLRFLVASQARKELDAYHRIALADDYRLAAQRISAIRSFITMPRAPRIEDDRQVQLLDLADKSPAERMGVLSGNDPVHSTLNFHIDRDLKERGIEVPRH